MRGSLAAEVGRRSTNAPATERHHFGAPGGRARGATASESHTEFKAPLGSSREAKIEGRSPRPRRQRFLSALPRLQKGWWPIGRLVRRPWRWP